MAAGSRGSYPSRPVREPALLRHCCVLPGMEAIEVRDLSMTYRAPVREPGLRAAVGSLFRRRYREVAAVRAISFDVAPGEVVGFIGPNGAGKTSTLKMLSSVMLPTSGRASVLGFTPWRREYAF